jgi:hypothetical protein
MLRVGLLRDLASQKHPEAKRRIARTPQRSHVPIALNGWNQWRKRSRGNLICAGRRCSLFAMVGFRPARSSFAQNPHTGTPATSRRVFAPQYREFLSGKSCMSCVIGLYLVDYLHSAETRKVMLAKPARIYCFLEYVPELAPAGARSSQNDFRLRNLFF